MKRYLIIYSILIISLLGCKNKNNDCCGPNCPLSSGQICTNGFVNENDQCICPEGKLEFGDICREKSSGSYYFDIDCLCFDFVELGFDSQTGSLSFGHIIGGEAESYLSGFQGTQSAFEIQMYRPCILPDGPTATPWLVGSIVDSTMAFEIEWRFFYWIDSTGEIFYSEPDVGEFISPLQYLDSVSDYSCGTIYSADRTP